MKMLNNMMIILIIAAIAMLLGCAPTSEQDIYFLPAEGEEFRDDGFAWCGLNDHGYADMIDGEWDALVSALHSGEKMHVVVCNKSEMEQIAGLLAEENGNLSQINFLVEQADQFWAKDRGPMFVLDKQGKTKIVGFS